MKLHYAHLSPYARKVRMVLAEKGLTDKVELITSNPWEENKDLTTLNPLGKIPCLLTDDGQAIYDSAVIVEYLDSLSGPKLIPASGAERWQVLRRAALAEGIADAMFNIACEVNRRPENERSPMFIKRWSDVIARSIHAVEGEIDSWGKDVTIAHVGLGMALGYVDFRGKDYVEWRSANPKTAAWYAEYAKRPSMDSTKPE